MEEAKQDYRGLYEQIVKSEWFKKAYHNKSLGAVIDRLQKVNARPAVSRDAVASDNIRLAIRQLRKLIQPQEQNTEPIDIFIV